MNLTGDGGRGSGGGDRSRGGRGGSVELSMFSFGAPRAGNPHYVARYNAAVPSSFRVVVDGDPVPVRGRVGLDEARCMCILDQEMERLSTSCRTSPRAVSLCGFEQSGFERKVGRGGVPPRFALLPPPTNCLSTLGLSPTLPCSTPLPCPAAGLLCFRINLWENSGADVPGFASHSGLLCRSAPFQGLPSWWYGHVGTKVLIDGRGRGGLVLDPSLAEQRVFPRSERRWGSTHGDFGLGGGEALRVC